ncbi:MAG: GAF domain-containing protein [Planctomycetota bacterium]
MTRRNTNKRRSELTRNLKKLRSSGRVKTVSPTPSEHGELFEAMLPEVKSSSEIDALRDEVRNLRRLHESVHFLSTAPDLASLRSEVLTLATSMAEMPRAMLALRSSKGGYKLKAVLGYEDRKSEEVRILRRILNRTLVKREVLLEGDILQEGILGFARRSDLDLGAVACLPLLNKGQLLGALLLDDPDRDRPFAPAEDSLLRGFARHVSAALARLEGENRLRRKMDDLARERDRLEGQKDRAMVLIERERKRASASQEELSALLTGPYAGAQRTFTRRFLAQALARSGGNVEKAARLAGLPPDKLRELMVKFRLTERNDSSSGSRRGVQV